MSKIKVGIVGLGHIGKNHARILSEIAVGEVEFAAVFDNDDSDRAADRGTLQRKAAASLEDFAARVDAATIATPTPTHHPIGKMLLERGKHVLIEKPITETTAHAKALVELAQRAQARAASRPHRAVQSRARRARRAAHAPAFHRGLTGSRRIRIAARKSASCSI